MRRYCHLSNLDAKQIESRWEKSNGQHLIDAFALDGVSDNQSQYYYTAGFMIYFHFHDTIFNYNSKHHYNHFTLNLNNHFTFNHIPVNYYHFNLYHLEGAMDIEQNQVSNGTNKKYGSFGSEATFGFQECGEVAVSNQKCDCSANYSTTQTGLSPIEKHTGYESWTPNSKAWMSGELLRSTEQEQDPDPDCNNSGHPGLDRAAGEQTGEEGNVKNFTFQLIYQKEKNKEVTGDKEEEKKEGGKEKKDKEAENGTKPIDTRNSDKEYIELYKSVTKGWEELGCQEVSTNREELVGESCQPVVRKENQKDICFITGESMDIVSTSDSVERGFEVPYMTEVMEEDGQDAESQGDTCGLNPKLCWEEGVRHPLSFTAPQRQNTQEILYLWFMI